MDATGFKSTVEGLQGLSDLLLGTSKTQKTNTTGNVTTTGSQSGTQTQQQKQQQEQQTTTTLLSQDVQDAIQQVVLHLTGGQIAPDTVSAQINNIAQTLTQRASTAASDINSADAAIISEAQRSGEKQIGRLQTDLAQQAGGSKDNTFVVGATAEGQAALQSQLAALKAQLGLTARNTQTQEYQDAIQALVQTATTSTAGSEAIAQLANVLRGATQTTASTTNATQQQLTDYTQTLKSIVDSLVNQTTKTKTAGLLTGLI